MWYPGDKYAALRCACVSYTGISWLIQHFEVDIQCAACRHAKQAGGVAKLLDLTTHQTSEDSIEKPVRVWTLRFDELIGLQASPDIDMLAWKPFISLWLNSASMKPCQNTWRYETQKEELLCCSHQAMYQGNSNMIVQMTSARNRRYAPTKYYRKTHSSLALPPSKPLRSKCHKTNRDS